MSSKIFDIDKADELLSQCMIADRQSIRHKLVLIEKRRRAQQPVDRLLAQINAIYTHSLRMAKRRASNMPAITFPKQLPVSEKHREIQAAIEKHPVVIVAGDTGSGKTTQLPKICVQAGRGVFGSIGHTQPRRLAATSVALRIAEEMQCAVGEQVAYKIRFNDKVTESTCIKLMTDGILLAEIQHDPLLQGYDTFIIDEAHERSLNIDFLLGYFKQLLSKRSDLKLIITSATINVERFAKHFDSAPVIDVEGRTFPIDLRYQPFDRGEEFSDVVADTIDQLLLEEDQQKHGDVLVFLNGEGEILDVAKGLRRRQLKGWEISPLYARLSTNQQQVIFRRSKLRRIVLATNVAETSLTVPGIRYVLDFGTARVSRYSVRTKVQRLPIEPISQASAKQRMGRCGRMEAGVCVRLYSEEDFLARPAFTDPEIQRTNLAAVILQMLAMGLGQVDDFPFVDPPATKQIKDGYKVLSELGAVDSSNRLTSVGKQLAKLPVDPRLGRVLIASANYQTLDEALIIASAISVQDPRERPQEKREQADQQHARFRDKRSDFVSYLNLWRYILELKGQLSQNQLRRRCQKEFLSYRRFREWWDVHRQLKLACADLGTDKSAASSYEQLHRSLLTGFITQIANHDERGEYLGVRNRRLRIFPGSNLRRQTPKWIMSAEIIETEQTYAHVVAAIEPEWLLGINDSLLSASYSEPYWHKNSGRVMAKQKLSLYGLAIAENKNVNYAAVDSQGARDIFIRQALVEYQLSPRVKKQWPTFLSKNKSAIDEVLNIEDRTRRRDLLIDELAMQKFYDAVLPDSLNSWAGLLKWVKKAGSKECEALLFAQNSLYVKDLGVDVPAQFPDAIDWDGCTWPLRYHFQPGHEEDGLNIQVPLSNLHRLPDYRFEWLVPGMLAEKCQRLLKMLPKAQRKQFVPIPATVEKLRTKLQPSDTPLCDALQSQLEQLTGIRMQGEVWPELDQLESYYRANYQVRDDNGLLIVQSRDLMALKKQLATEVSHTLREHTAQQSNEARLTAWQFDQLLKKTNVKQEGATIKAFTALEAKADHVSVVLLADEAQAQQVSVVGVARLLLLKQANLLKRLRRDLLASNVSHLQLARIHARREEWLEDVLLAAAIETYGLRESIPQLEAQFDTLFNGNKHLFLSVVNSYEQLAREILSLKVVVMEKLSAIHDKEWRASCDDMQAQLEQLFPSSFFQITDLEYLREYPRYLQALVQRIDKLRGNYQKEQAALLSLCGWQQRLFDYPEDYRYGKVRAQWHEFRWMLEEYRVSLFAQSLGTRKPVSEKRLQKMWDHLENAK